MSVDILHCRHFPCRRFILSTFFFFDILPFDIFFSTFYFRHFTFDILLLSRFFDCDNGEDEFDNCFLIEINQCEENEYRCLNGMCIPKTYLIDLSYDCGDMTDEAYSDEGLTMESEYCYNEVMILCDFSQTSWELFSCGDGQYVEGYDELVCSNGRHFFYLRNLYLSSLSTNNNEIFQCWFLLYCVTNEDNFKLLSYERSQCLCKYDNREKNKCLKYFKEYCPSLFYFQTELNLVYPFVKFVYNKTNINSFEWWKPTHVCYNKQSCSNLLFDNYFLIDDLICTESETILFVTKSYFYSLKKFFTHCNRSIEDKKFLFYCNQSKQFISKYRIEDSVEDCYYGEDEDDDITSKIMYSINQRDRFKCKADNKSMVRSLIYYYDSYPEKPSESGYCEDESYKLYLGKCIRSSDLACQFMRGSFIPSIYNIFRENCNRINYLKISIDNETDETNCEEWSTNKCDNYWDLKNGIDELNCPHTISNYIRENIFKCQKNEHYCANQDGTISCLPIERAGDGFIDCLWATDERETIPQEIDNEVYRESFKCRSEGMISIYRLCNKVRNCRHNDDEIICPWLFNSSCNDEFSCKNGTCINRVRNQCNGIIDCQENGEDEWFCDLDYSKDKQFSLNNIEEYPLINKNSLKISVNNDYHLNQSFQIKEISVKRQNDLKNWYCNRGIIVQYRLSKKKRCLCPPSYYGLRCQYQSEFVLITVRIDIPISLAKSENKNNILLIIARLILDDQIFDYEQVFHKIFMKQIFYLNYPQPPPKKQGNWSVRLDAYLINFYHVDYKSSWLFNIPFSFLPVNRLVLHLLMKDSQRCSSLNCIHGVCQKYLNPPYDEYCQCEDKWSGKFCNETINCSCIEGGKCVNGYLKPICICPLGRIGKECRVLFNPCMNVKCENGGRCLPLDERQSNQFVCSCLDGYFGIYCEQISSQAHIAFSSSLSAKNSESKLITVFVHFLKLEKDSPGILFVENRFLYKQINLNEILHVYNDNRVYLSPFILIEIYFQNNIFDYYIAGILKKNLISLDTKIDEINRCPFVDELIFNETVRKFPSRKKVKYYHYVCEMNHFIKCFQDESFLCFCDQFRQPDCLVFQRQSIQCSTNYCQNNGRCIENTINGVWDFGCVCNGCSFGSLCQLITSDYVLSFDTILGQDITASMSFKEQTFIIKFVLSIIIFMILIGTLSNVLSLITFRQGNIPEYGCGIYLFCLPLIGQIGLCVFGSRYFYLLITQLYNVHNQWFAYWSCIILEYMLTVCPMLFDWLVVCIAVERCVNIIKGALFKKRDSVKWAKRLIPFLIFIVICSSWHELFIHELVSDPRMTNEHTWCVIKFPWIWIRYYRLIIHLINLIIPGFINLITTVFLLHQTTRRKQALKTKKSEKMYWKIFRKQIPKYGSPFGLVILSIMRVTFSFTLVCITKQWHKYLYFIAYFISFVPLMATFPIFILTAKVYKTEFKKFFARCIRQLRAKWS